MDAITYDLEPGGSSAARYYEDVANFADQVRAELHAVAGPAVDAFRAFVAETGLEGLRSRDEYALELLVLGVLWRVYGPQVIGGARRRAEATVRPVPRADLPTVAGLVHLLTWLVTTGELRAEADRLRPWREHLGRLPAPVASRRLALAVELAEWFEHQAEAALGRYTQGVEAFRRQAAPTLAARADWALRDRRPVEYHLQMVGAEILNGAFRPAFRRTARKVLLLPACMRARHGGGCALGACNRCSPGCRVAALTDLGRSAGFEVTVVPHATDYARWTERAAVAGDVGVIGAACVLSLLAGGWQARAAGIPAQCVVLNAVGCRAHWDLGRPTDLYVPELLRIVGAEAAEAHAADVGAAVIPLRAAG